jgi:early secretory antigenic target protein ESAT-6
MREGEARDGWTQGCKSVAASGEISVQFADIEEAAATVRRTAANVDLLLSDLRTMLRPIAAEWTGAASSNYQYQQHIWDLAAQDLHAVLLQIAAALENSHASYTDTETSLHQLWGN